MSETKQPPAPKIPQKTKDQRDLEQLQQLIEQMTPETRDKLARAGVAVPNGDITALGRDHYKYGMLCTKCHRIGLFFVGDRWEMHGQPVDEPPPLPHSMIAWTQQLPPHEIDRVEPKCQHCRSPLPTNPDGSFSRERKRIVLLEQYEMSRDKRFDSKAARAVDREATKAVAGMTGQFDRDYDAKKVAVSQTIAEQTGDPNIADQINQVADQTGATAALASGFRS